MIFLALFLLAGAVQAVPPFQGSEATDGQLVILYPDMEYVKLDETVNYNFLIVNSTGAIVNASAGEVSCDYGIEDKHGNIQAIGSVSTSSHWIYFSLVNNETERFGYAIWCNASNGEYGYLVGYYDVTTTGLVEPTDGKILAGLLALIPLFLALIFLVGSATLGEDHNVLRIGLFLISPVFVIASLHWMTLSIIKFFEFPELQDAVGSGLYWMVIIWGVLIVYFIIYTIYTAVHVAAEKKDKRLNY